MMTTAFSALLAIAQFAQSAPPPPTVERSGATVEIDTQVALAAYEQGAQARYWDGEPTAEQVAYCKGIWFAWASRHTRLSPKTRVMLGEQLGRDPSRVMLDWDFAGSSDSATVTAWANRAAQGMDAMLAGDASFVAPIFVELGKCSND